MIDKIISLLIYMGVTFFTGYGLWHISNLEGAYAILASGIGLSVIVFSSIKFKNNTVNFTQFLGIVGFSYLSTLIYKTMVLIPSETSLITDLKYWVSTFLALIYVYAFYKKLAPTALYKIFTLLASLSFVAASLNMIRVYLNVDVVVSLLSLLALWEMHKVQIKDKTTWCKNLLTSTKTIMSEQKEEVNPGTPYNLGTLNFVSVIASILLITHSVQSSILGVLPFYTLTTFFYGLLIALNTKIQSVKGFFWVHLVLMFFSIYQIISLSTSTWILVGGVACFSLAYFLKKLKDHPTMLGTMKNYVPEFLKSYEVKD